MDVRQRIMQRRASKIDAAAFAGKAAAVAPPPPPPPPPPPLPPPATVSVEAEEDEDDEEEMVRAAGMIQARERGRAARAAAVKAQAEPVSPSDELLEQVQRRSVGGATIQRREGRRSPNLANRGNVITRL